MGQIKNIKLHIVTDIKANRKMMSAIHFLVIGCMTLISTTILAIPAIPIPNEDATLEATVFLKTTDAVDIKALKNIAGVSSVYRLGPHFLFMSIDEKGQGLNHQWNYAVVAKGLKDSADQDRFMSEVSGMDFVELFAGYRLSVRPDQDAERINSYIKQADPKHFVKRPMRPASPRPPCPAMHLKEGERLKIISMRRVGDIRSAMKAGHDVILTIFPALKVSYNYIGSVDSSQVWNTFDVVDWDDVATFCEYIQSQWVKDMPKKYPNLSKGFAAGLAVEV